MTPVLSPLSSGPGRCSVGPVQGPEVGGAGGPGRRGRAPRPAGPRGARPHYETLHFPRAEAGEEDRGAALIWPWQQWRRRRRRRSSGPSSKDGRRPVPKRPAYNGPFLATMRLFQQSLPISEGTVCKCELESGIREVCHFHYNNNKNHL